MLERGNWLRRFLCLWGWHDWIKHREIEYDSGFRTIIMLFYFIVMTFSPLAVFILAIAPDTTVFGIAGLVWTLLSLGCFMGLPHAMRGHWIITLGRVIYYDATCIYCHRHVQYLTRKREKDERDTHYRETLASYAQEKWKETQNEKR